MILKYTYRDMGIIVESGVKLDSNIFNPYKKEAEKTEKEITPAQTRTRRTTKK